MFSLRQRRQTLRNLTLRVRAGSHMELNGMIRLKMHYWLK